MKKILCLNLVFLLLLYTGCEKINVVKKEPLILSGFNATVKTEKNGVTIISNVKYSSASGYEYTFTAPKTLENTTLTCLEGVFTISGEKLNITLNNNELPETMLCRAIYDCVNAVNGAKYVAKNEYLEYAYIVDDVHCVLYTDENKNFKKLTVGNWEYIFETFSYTQ